MTLIPKQLCPKCHKILDRAVGMNAALKAGDLTVCLRCTSILEIDQDLRLQPVAPEKLALLDAETLDGLMKIQHVIRRIQHMLGEWKEDE